MIVIRRVASLGSRVIEGQAPARLRVEALGGLSAGIGYWQYLADRKASFSERR